ncbi:MAG: polysulfide reductase NrfD [Candidatus Hydrogenedentes bacterium]|nr:polysulfide reductase NrfD [Candidatus Hydrogenedentota bacterium]
MTTSAKYEQLLQDLRKDLRPQREWGEGRGLFLVIGHFVVGVASGAWLLSVFYAYPAGLALAYILAALGGAAHLAFLGHPGRFWRMATKVRSSWISRGFVGLSLFLLGGLLYLIPVFLPGTFWGPDSLLSKLGYVLAFAGTLALMGYMGFVYTASKAIPFWNSPLHPVLYIAYALRGGVAALLLTLWAVDGGPVPGAGLLLLWLGVTGAVVVMFALEIHGALTSGNAAARRSVHELLAGRVAVYFYGGTLAIGLAVPAWLALAGLGGPLSMGALAMIGLASVVGDFFMKYSTIRAGIRLPVWTRLTPKR